MSMYFIGIDISKYKHDCCIISAADQKVVSKVTIKNNKAGFNELLTIIHSLANPADIRIPLIRFDMTFATYYAKKRGEGKPHRVAITHVAKKLIRVIYALERQDIDFNAQKLR